MQTKKGTCILTEIDTVEITPKKYGLCQNVGHISNCPTVRNQ